MLVTQLKIMGNDIFGCIKRRSSSAIAFGMRKEDLVREKSFSYFYLYIKQGKWVGK